MSYRDEVAPTTREEIAFRLMNTLLRADAKEIDRVLKLYALCARVVENPHILEEEEPQDRRELLAQSH
ncbi:hypothetical protein QBC99_001876 [Beijerinckia sp. GAS462]|nr:hypothetical protein [Beijerinckia sp. GAS462]SEC17481.1 hypothetical protein SAMN05443249_2091 [Beijerinckia sp. 28-YEA-48]